MPDILIIKLQFTLKKNNNNKGTILHTIVFILIRRCFCLPKILYILFLLSLLKLMTAQIFILNATVSQQIPFMLEIPEDWNVCLIVVDVDDLKVFSKNQGAQEADELSHWDITFWSERLRESKFDINEVGS